MAIKPVTTSDVEPVVITAKTQRLIDTIRPQFASFANDFGAIVVKREALAPKFMKAANAWQAESGQTFVSFVRMLDGTIPEERAKYRAHPVFQAADYLRRLAGRADRPKTSETTGHATAATPLEAVARLVATVFPLVSENADALWQAFAAELHWTDAQVKRVQSMAAQMAPILVPKRGTGHDVLKAAA